MKQKKAFLLPSVVQGVMRFMLILLLYFAFTGGQKVLFGCLAGAVLIFGLMPGRYWLGRMLQGDAAKAQYPRRVLQGMARFGCGIVWCLPVIGFAGWMLHALTTLPFNKAGQIIKQFSFLVFSPPSADTGVMGVGVVLAVLALIAAFGWRRQMAMEYLRDTALLSGRELMKKTADIRKKGAKKLAGVTAVNVLIALPGMAIFAAVLVPYVWGQLSLAKGNTMMMLQLLLDMLKKPLPGEQLLLLAAAYVLVYLPLHLVRKMRIAKAVRALEKE